MIETMTKEATAHRIIRVGVISDTHGYLDAKVEGVFGDTDLIVHAGDIGHPEILAALEAIAPVTAVKGNMDRGPWADKLPAAAMLTAGGLTLYVLHDKNQLDLIPTSADIRAVITGHSHCPSLETRDGVIFLNPGSASEPRYQHPPTVAILTIRQLAADAAFIDLSV